MKFGRNLVVTLGAVGLLAAAGLVTVACSSKSSGGTTPPPDTDAGSDAACASLTPSNPSGSAPMCTAAAGAFPPSNCDNSAQMCPTTIACASVSCSCASQANPGACEPLANNTGSTLNFRMRSINIAAPPALANNTVQGGVVTPAVSLSATQAPNCGENGDGTFNWLISINKTANTLTTGGAPISTDPFGMGYCFLKENVGGIQVGPVTGPVTFSGSSFTTTPLTSTLNIPIFTSTSNTPIILPIRGGVLSNVTISADNNCVGTFNPTALSNKCSVDTTECQEWNTGGALGGYITLKDADNVQVSLLGESLCVLLTNTAAMKTATGQCPASAFTMGDYCSTTNAPGGCNDSYWLAATFAASAVNINSGAGVAECSGGGAADGG